MGWLYYSILEMGIEPNPNEPKFSKNQTELELRCRKNEKSPNRTEPNNEGSFPSLVLSALSALADN